MGVSTTDPYNRKAIYTVSYDDWQSCPMCGKKLFKVLERKGSKVEVKCRGCGATPTIAL